MNAAEQRQRRQARRLKIAAMESALEAARGKPADSPEALAFWQARAAVVAL